MSMDFPVDLPEIMGLDRDLIVRVAYRTRQWAEATVADVPNAVPAEPGAAGTVDAEQRRREAASLFTIAGSYMMLLDAHDAGPALRTAREHFSQLGSTYAHPLAVCGADTRAAYSAVEESDDRPLAPGDRANVLLALSWADMHVGQDNYQPREAFGAHIQSAQPVAATEVGRLRMPLAAMMRVLNEAAAVFHEGEGNVPRLVGAAHDFLIRAHDIAAAAMADHFHWQSLMCSALPVEPEAAAVGAIVMSAALRREADAEVMERLDLPSQALVPLIVGRRIAETAVG